MRIIGFVFFFLFVLLVVSLIFGGIYFLLSRIFLSIHERLAFSPLEDNTLIKNTEWCKDSDNGVFSGVKGRVYMRQSFLFFRWDMKLEDKCDGNQLSEFYCTDTKNIYGRGIIECLYGCADGKCKESPD